MEREVITARMYMEGVLPSIPKVCEFYQEIGAKFSNRTFTLQVVVDDRDNRDCFYFDVKEGVWTAHVQECIPKPDIEFAFNSYKQFNSFFAGSNTIVPHIKGLFKVNLLKDTITLLAKFANTFWTRTPLDDENAANFQQAVFMDALPRMVRVLKRDALFEIVTNFSVEENVAIKATIADGDITLPTIFLEYAPTEGDFDKPLEEYSLTFASRQEFLEVMLGGDFTQESKALNDNYPMAFVKYFVELVNYHLRLDYRK